MQITEKYNRIEVEYESFKAKLFKEYKHLKNDYDIAYNEIDILKETLFEFKKYFMRFHITEDGEVAFREDN